MDDDGYVRPGEMAGTVREIGAGNIISKWLPSTAASGSFGSMRHE
jgi:hypothetical protein